MNQKQFFLSLAIQIFTFFYLRCCMNTTEMTSDASKAAGVWGSFTCDLPYWTFEDMLRQIKETHGDVRYL